MCRYAPMCVAILLISGGCGESPSPGKADGGTIGGQDGAGGDRAGGDGPATDGTTADAAAQDRIPDAPVDVAKADAMPPECDPAKQDCPSGQRCDLICPDNRVGCQTDTGGGASEGEACGSCKKGHACFSGIPGYSGSRCFKYCATDADCTAPRTCTTSPLGCAPGKGYVHICI